MDECSLLLNMEQLKHSVLLVILFSGQTNSISRKLRLSILYPGPDNHLDTRHVPAVGKHLFISISLDWI